MPITTQAGLRSVTRNAEPKISQLSWITFVIGGFSFSSLFDVFDQPLVFLSCQHANRNVAQALCSSRSERPVRRRKTSSSVGRARVTVRIGTP
jgi:hypothetical protein